MKFDSTQTMHVKIVGFKCHLDSSYDFDPDSMILLRGESGAGKSTVLQAIFWALYGSMRGVYNNTGQIKKCSVTLQINQLIIYRQKRPELLQVTIINPIDRTERMYVDTVAQQIIDQAFGSKELWKSCSYVCQKERCSLLSGSSAERLSLLNQLSFDQDTPKDYITKIDQQLKDINKKFIEVQATFTAEVGLYTQQLNTRPVTVTLTDEQINKLRVEITNLEQETNRLYQEVLTHERNIGSYNMVTTQLSQTEAQLVSLGVIEYDEDQYNRRVSEINDTIKRLREQITLIRHYNNIKSQSEKLQLDINTNKAQKDNIDSQINTLLESICISEEKLREMGYDSSVPINVTSQMIWQSTQQETQRQKHMSESQQLGCDYRQESINNIVKKLQKEVSMVQNMERNVQIYNRLKSLQSQLTNLGLVPTDVTSERITELEEQSKALALEISELKKGLELLQCPECSKPLRYVNNQLVPGERDPVDPSRIQQKEAEYNNILNQIRTIRAGIQFKGEIHSIEAQLNHINIEEVEKYMHQPKNISQHQGLISRYMRIQIIPPPTHSSSYLQSILSHNQLVSNKSQLETQKQQLLSRNTELINQLSKIQIPEIPSNDMTSLNTEITKYESELKSLRTIRQKNLQHMATQKQLVSSINALKKQQEKLEQSLNPTAKTTYENNQQQLQNNKTKHIEAQYSKDIMTRQKQLETKRQVVLDLNDDLISLQRLKQNAINVECKQLQDTVDNINQTLSDILPLFFTEPIDMTLQLYKMLKTKKQIKPGLNISIKYMGVEYDNINQLSGGEGDRISLALVLALNQVSNSPVVMLDECVSSLDGTLKEACIRAMKKLDGKTIICVDHEGVEGYYDKTIVVMH